MAHTKLLVIRDADLLAGLPPDAHIVGHRLTRESLSLIVESQTFPHTPDGLPLDQMQPFIAKPAATASGVRPESIQPPVPTASASATAEAVEEVETALPLGNESAVAPE